MLLPDVAAEILSGMLKSCSFLQEQDVLGLYPVSDRCWIVQKGKSPLKRKQSCISGIVEEL